MAFNILLDETPETRYFVRVLRKLTLRKLVVFDFLKSCPGFCVVVVNYSLLLMWPAMISSTMGSRDSGGKQRWSFRNFFCLLFTVFARFSLAWLWSKLPIYFISANDWARITPLRITNELRIFQLAVEPLKWIRGSVVVFSFATRNTEQPCNIKWENFTNQSIKLPWLINYPSLIQGNLALDVQGRYH